MNARRVFLALALCLTSAAGFAAPTKTRKAPAKKAPLVVGQGVIVTLRTGALIEGIYHGDADGAIWVEVDGGDVGIEKDTIAGMSPIAKTASTEYKERAAALGAKDAAGWWELSMWAASKDLHGAAESAARTVLKIDPEHARARDLLGFEKVDGRWLQHDEVHRAKGLVLYERRWLTPQQVEEAKARARQEEKENNLRAMKLHAPATYEAPKKPLGGWVDRPQGGR